MFYQSKNIENNYFCFSANPYYKRLVFFAFPSFSVLSATGFEERMATEMRFITIEAIYMKYRKQWK